MVYLKNRALERHDSASLIDSTELETSLKDYLRDRDSVIQHKIYSVKAQLTVIMRDPHFGPLLDPLLERMYDECVDKILDSMAIGPRHTGDSGLIKAIETQENEYLFSEKKTSVLQVLRRKEIPEIIDSYWSETQYSNKVRVLQNLQAVIKTGLLDCGLIKSDTVGTEDPVALGSDHLQARSTLNPQALDPQCPQAIIIELCRDTAFQVYSRGMWASALRGVLKDQVPKHTVSLLYQCLTHLYHQSKDSDLVDILKLPLITKCMTLSDPKGSSARHIPNRRTSQNTDSRGYWVSDTLVMIREKLANQIESQLWVSPQYFSQSGAQSTYEKFIKAMKDYEKTYKRCIRHRESIIS